MVTSAIRLMTLACLLLLCSAAARAEVRTMLEPRLIDEMETVRLTIRVSGRGQVEQPDFTPLEKDFEVLGTQNSSRISSINGRTSAVIEYQVTLRPKRTGQLEVPSLQVGDEFTEAIELAVRPMDPGVRDAIAEMIFFETEFSANPVYVQAQTVLIRRLYYSNGVQIYSDLPGVPELPNAVVVPLGETRSTTTVRDGRRYGVIEQRFAIFPEHSGTLTVPSISVTSSVRLQSGGRTRRSGIRVATEEVTLEVKPIPAAYPASEPWLPAEALDLSADWNPDRGSYDIGEPLSLSVSATVTGNIASSIPPVPLQLEDHQFKVYPEAPSLTEDSAGQRLIGRRERTFALIPTAPGRITIPAISMTWWDTSADMLRHSEIGPRTVQISGSLPATAAPAQPETALPETEAATPATATRLTLPAISTQLLIAAGLLLLLALAALLYRFRFIPLPKALRRSASRRSVKRRHFQALRRSARGSDPADFKARLTDYLTLAYDCPSTEALHRFRHDPRAAEQLERLDAALYSPRQTRSASGVDVQLLLTLALAAGASDRQAAADLPPLYS